MIALLWSTLNVSDFSSESWGTQSNALIAFINGLISTTGFLNSQTWFSQVLQSWGRSDLAQLRGSISQHDAAEFVSHWLDLLGTSVVDMGWERRVQHENGTFAVDRSSSSLPLFLQFDRQTMQQSSCELSLLVELWHQADGMVASLTSHAQCICIHLDRCVQLSASDPVTKCSTKLAIEHLCPVPVFQGEGLQFEFKEYLTIALQAHLGGDSSGHYRTALRIQPTVAHGTTPAHWLLCDDWRSPQPVWQLPEWFEQNITLLWLLRSDSALLHQYQDYPLVTQDETIVDAMLALLPLRTEATE